MASHLEMYSKYDIANWIARPSSKNWLENGQWLMAISSFVLHAIMTLPVASKYMEQPHLRFVTLVM